MSSDTYAIMPTLGQPPNKVAPASSINILNLKLKQVMRFKIWIDIFYSKYTSAVLYFFHPDNKMNEGNTENVTITIS